MAPTVYKSSDASAPTLSGTTGTLISVLDACLVNGYGSKTAAGWTKAFSGTNLASYLPAAGHYLDVNDAAAGANGAKEATVRGYESMTAVGTGTNPFPTTAQIASPGEFVRKSVTADGTARGWWLIADQYTFYLFILSGDSVGFYTSFGFGRFYSTKTGDTYRSIILGHNATGSGSATGLDVGSPAGAFNNLTGGVYLARVAAGTGTSSTCGIMGFSAGFNTFSAGPNPNDGNIYLSRMFLNEALSSTGIRGYLRGVYQIITANGLNDGDTFTGAGDFAGRTFVVLNKTTSGAYLAVETSAWDSSS
jgi:hypothetical protein